jgi:hypothetical protein
VENKEKIATKWWKIKKIHIIAVKNNVFIFFCLHSKKESFFKTKKFLLKISQEIGMEISQ